MWPFTKKKPARPPRRPMVAVRMEAIGGQGANSAGKILAEAAVLGQSFTGNHFSSFGSEKRGSPVRSFVRFSPDRRVIRSASFISRPDFLVVFHENLLATHPEIFEGAGPDTDLLVNSKSSPDQLKFPLAASFRRVGTIDATKLALKHACGLNAVMLGACCDFIGELDPRVLETTLERFFGRSPLKARNLEGFADGRGKVKTLEFRPGQASLEIDHSPLPRLGYLNAPIGGLVTNPGNTVLKDNSASRRGIAPRFIKELCFNCGYCDQVCPDFCFVWKKSDDPKTPYELTGIDYQYCKGCQKCVVACPVEALVPVAESELSESDRQTRLFPEAAAALVEERWRQLDWPRFIEDLNPDARMLTLQTELLDPKSYIRPNLKKERGEK